MADRKVPMEELIALRDGLQTTGRFRRDVAANVAALKDLAEARLFALLMALPAADGVANGGEIPPPEMLLRYLVNSLPSAEVRAVEAMVRGNTEAMDLLVVLKDALFRSDVWRREEHVAAPDPGARIDLGGVRIARLPRNLGFAAIETLPEIEEEAFDSMLDFSLSEVENDAQFSGHAETTEPPEQSLLRSIDYISQAIEGMQEALGELSRDLRMGIKARRLPVESARIAVLALRGRMQSIEALLPLLDDASRRVGSEAVAAKVRRELDRARDDAKRRAAAEAAALHDPRLDWPTTFTLAQPELEIELRSVTTFPTPTVGIHVRQMTDRPARAPEATVVELGVRFINLELDQDGMFVTAWPTSPVLLLIDTDRTYSIRLEPA